MQLIRSLLLIAFVQVVDAVPKDNAFYPTRLALQSLTAARVEQVVSTAGFFTIDTQDAGFKQLKASVLKEMAECMESEGSQAVEYFLPDGTLRRTLATHTRQAVKAEPVEMSPLVGQTDGTSDSCRKLEQVSMSFRLAISEITKEVAAIMTQVAATEGSKPLLKTREGFEFEDFEKVVRHGEHLEHFHSYTKGNSNINSDMTLDWHTDQGIFLIFTPGQSGDSLNEGGDFYIKDENGVARRVSFESNDDLVVLMGDGMIQLFSGNKFHTPAHAVHIKESAQPRVWYGRMVLAPPKALHPVVRDVTFGEHREGMIKEQGTALAVGCTSPKMMARELQGASIEACGAKGQFYCWHRCFNYTKAVSPQTCGKPGRVLCKSNTTGALWNRVVRNPEYQPACSTERLNPSGCRSPGRGLFRKKAGCK